jgi:hypothetical protein
MPTNTFSPAVIHKAKDLFLGEGALYKDYVDEDTKGTLIGATRGGTKLEIEWSKKEVDYDGSMGPTKGMRRTERFVAKLVVNFLKLTYINLAYGLNVTVSDGSDADGTYKKIAFNTSFASTDLLSNITFRGFKANGEFCVIILENALNIDNISLEFKEKDEVISEMTYTGFYTYAAPTTPPLAIREEIPA